MKHIPGKTQPWLKVFVVLLVEQWQGRRTNLNQSAVRQELGPAVVLLERRHIPLIAQPKFEREIGGDLETVLSEEIKSALNKVRSHISDAGVEEGIAVDEVGGIRELDEPEVMLERAVVIHLPAFPTEFESVPAAKISDRVAEHGREIAASLRKSRDAAEIQSPLLNIDFRQADGSTAPIVDPELGWVVFVDRVENDMDPVEAQARFIDKRWVEDMALAHR